MKKKLMLVLLVLLGIISVDSGFSSAQSSKPLLLRMPTLSRTHIVFVYAGDLWIVARDGGEASRLTTGVGSESGPQFSPDGKTVAFTGEYDGNVDVYTVPATGGVPKRLTYHAGTDSLAGWTNDSKQVLFLSQRNSYSGRFARLFTMPIDGVFPTEVPLPMGYAGSYSMDGSKLAYEPIQRAFNAWKRYRGGMASQIWVANLADSSVEKLPRENSNDFNPMYIGDKVYFLSDRSGPISLFSYDTKTKKVSQLITNNGLDIKSASASSDAIVYEQFGTINIYDLKSGKSKPVNITVNGDMPALRAKFEKVGTRIMNATISPTGARAIFEARGDIISVPAEKGDARNLTNTTAVAERDPSWSPDGKWIAYFSDESGEYALHLRDQKGMGEVKKINLGNPPSFFYSPTWSPDSKKIAFSDKRLNVWYVDIDKGTPVKVVTDIYDAWGVAFTPTWSPDSKWITYSKFLPNHQRAVFVYSLESGKSTQLTDGLSDARYPVFDKGGKYLFFAASTDVALSGTWLDLSGFQRPVTRSVYAIVLKKGDPNPMEPQSDDEKVAKAEEKGKEGEKDKDKGKDADKKNDKKDEKKDEKKEEAVTVTI